MQYTTKEYLTRLYRDGFPEDSEDFVRYFFDEIYSEENVITKYDMEEMISCAHIVMKSMKYYGDIVPLPYLVAVSTLTPHRGKGEIASVIHDALDLLMSRHNGLVALYPFRHDYYTKYGFVTVDSECSASRLSDIDATLVPCADVDVLQGVYSEYELLYDIAIHRDVEDMKRRLDALVVDKGETYLIEKDSAIKGYVMAYGDVIEELVLLDDSILSGESIVDRDNVMMRVVDICSALQSMPFDIEESTRRQIRVHDAFYGDRLVLLDIFDGEVYTRYLDSLIYSIPTIDINIEDLTLYVMGKINVLGLPKVDRAKISLVDKY